MKLQDIASSERVSSWITKATTGPNHLTKVIRSHYAVETGMMCLLREVVKMEGFSELDRLNFASRAELACALGVIRKDSMPLLRQMNKIRNRFAHNPHSKLTSKDANELMNCLSAFQRGMIKHALKTNPRNASTKEAWNISTFCMCVELSSFARKVIHDRISTEVTARRVNDVLSTIPIERQTETIRLHQEEVEMLLAKQVQASSDLIS